MEYHLLLSQLLLLFSCSWCLMGSSHNISTDTEALLTFKSKYIKSDPQSALLAWNNSFHVCSWPGISCARKRTHVTAIDLTGRGIVGTIPPHLSNLSSLTSLNLSHNLFDGQLPPQLGQLSLLQDLILTNNSIQGTIPISLSSCLNLRKLSLRNNHLIGSIPSELGFLTQMKVFSAAQNNLTGPIPTSFGNLTSLISLYLTYNELSGEIPKELGHLPSLRYLQLGVNQLSGEIPSSVYNISSLVTFSVTTNRLVGELPPHLGDTLPNLEELLMASNKLHGPIPYSLSNISGIQWLDLANNSFTGPLPLLGKMYNLFMVNLAVNHLTSTTKENIDVFNSLMNCTQLETLSLPLNQLAGQLPSATANLSVHLRDFCVEGNELSGNFPEGMDRYENLSVLALQKNHFTGTVPRTIGLLPRLQRFHLDDNFFFGELPDTFNNLTSLYQLTLSSNQFSGRIPKSIGECKHLEVLDLSRNNLSGSIPKEIFEISDSTRYFSLAHNSLSGSLPNEVGILKMISFMDVSDNEISGKIPESLGDCSNLQYLILSENKFHGSVPKFIERLKGLVKLDLSSNHLSGQIPTSLGKLTYLRTLNLSFNDLYGQVPMEGVFMNLTWDSLQGNNHLCCDGNRVERQKLRLPTCTTNKGYSKASLALKIAIPIVACALLLCVVLCLCYITSRHRKRRNVGKRGLSQTSFRGTHRKISYGEILSATNGFDPKNFIGKGAFGSVYRGIIGSENDRAEQGSSNVVAIKVINLKQSKASRAFEAECEALRNIRHRNLVKVITSCSSIDHSGAEFKALVMEFMSNGSLDEWLYPEKESRLSLSLVQRLNIAIDVAMAMDYLHHDCEPPVAHCDLKPSNVLLDDEMTAHVADFGLSRFLTQTPAKSLSGTVGLKGSIGYIAPEYGLGGNASTDGDSYGYGILLLEMFTCKKPTDEIFVDGLNLKKFAGAVYENRVMEVVDPKLIQGGHDAETTDSSSSMNTSDSNSTESDWQQRKEKCLEAIIQVGLSCAADAPRERLNMREALTKMHVIKETLLQMRGN